MENFNMRKFYFEDNFEDEDEDDFEDEMIEKGIHEDKVALAQLDLFELELNKKILIMAIKICENSFFWKLYSMNKKMNLISNSYNKLIEILNGEEDAHI